MGIVNTSLRALRPVNNSGYRMSLAEPCTQAVDMNQHHLHNFFNECRASKRELKTGTKRVLKEEAKSELRTGLP